MARNPHFRVRNSLSLVCCFGCPRAILPVRCSGNEGAYTEYREGGQWSAGWDVLADELNGTLDTGVQFRKKGFVTFVTLKCSHPFPDALALVFNLESRHLSGEMAYEGVQRICKKLNGRILYKKIDSTLRGNVGWEIVAMLDGLGCNRAILVPSYPAQGRTVENGILRMNGIPLH